MDRVIDRNSDGEGQGTGKTLKQGSRLREPGRLRSFRCVTETETNKSYSSG